MTTEELKKADILSNGAETVAANPHWQTNDRRAENLHGLVDVYTNLLRDYHNQNPDDLTEPTPLSAVAKGSAMSNTQGKTIQAIAIRVDSLVLLKGRVNGHILSQRRGWDTGRRKKLGTVLFFEDERLPKRFEIEAAALWPQFGSQLVYNYEGQKVSLYVADAEAMALVIENTQPQYDPVNRMAQWTQLAQFINRLMIAQGLPPIIPQLPAWEDKEYLLRRGQAWVTFMSKLDECIEFFASCDERLQQRVMRYVRRLVASIQVAISAQQEIKKQRNLRVSELTGLTVTRERNELLIKVASDVRTLRQMEDELKKLKEFEERHFWEGGFLPNLPIRRFLPLNFPGLMQRERGGPQGPNPEGPPGPVCPGPEGPEGPGGPEGPQFPIVLHGPDEEDAWARIGEMEKIDLENPTVRAMLMASNRKFRLYLRVFRCKEAYTPLGSFKRHKYYLLLIKTEQGIPVACFVCPENDHADYWLIVDETMRYIFDSIHPRHWVRAHAETFRMQLIHKPGWVRKALDWYRNHKEPPRD